MGSRSARVVGDAAGRPLPPDPRRSVGEGLREHEPFALVGTRLASLVAPDHRFTDTCTGEQHDADRPHEDELQGAPAPQQHDQVKPAGAAVGDEAEADGCDQGV